MKRVLLLTAVGAVALSGVVLIAQDAKVAAGKKAYDAEKCSTCHMIAGTGMKALNLPLDGVGAKLTAADLKKWFTDTTAMEAKLPKKPTVKMSDYLKTHKLSDADVDALVAYMQSLK